MRLLHHDFEFLPDAWDLAFVILTRNLEQLSVEHNQRLI